MKTTEPSRKNIELEELLISWGIENFELRNRLEADKSKTKCSAWCGYEKWQGLYVFSNKYYSGLSEEEAPLQIVEVSNKIEKMQLLYGYNFVKEQVPIKLQTFDNIADSIEKEYSMMITDNKHEVVSAELAFLVKDVHDQTDLDMEPVWVITIQEYKEGNRSEYSEYQEVYSAVTSKNVG